MGRKARRQAQRRQAVVDAALDLFEEHGYDATTVESIADTSGISLRSFYRYIDSKDGVLASLGSTLVEELIDRSRDRPSISSLAIGLAEIFDEHRQQRGIELFLRLLREQPELRDKVALWQRQWAQQLARGLADRDRRSEPSPDELVVSRMAIEAVTIAVDHWNTQPAGSISAHTKKVLRLLRIRL